MICGFFFFFSAVNCFSCEFYPSMVHREMDFGNRQMLFSFQTQANKAINMNGIKLSLAHCMSQYKFFGYRKRSVFI